VSVTSKSGGKGSGEKKTNYALAIGPGFEFGAFDFRASYYVMPLKETLDSSGFMFSLSWCYQAGFAGSSSNSNQLHRGKKRKRGRSKRRRRSFDFD
jgi:hypothetical protein